MAQAWICSNCGLKRTFHRVSRVHHCQQQNLDMRQQGHGIWRKGNNNNFPRVTIWPPTDFFKETDYLIWLKTNTVVIVIAVPQPFNMTTPNRSRSKHLCK